MPRCKNCKEKFEAIHFNQKYCFKEECKKVWFKKASFEQWAIEKPKIVEKLNPDKPKKYLEEEINKLSRMIDASFGYIDCIDCQKPLNDVIHAAHFHNKGGHENLRYHLDGLHSARGHCNQFSSEHKSGYYDGLILRYGQEYADYVKYELPKLYPYLGLKAPDYPEKLKIVRKIIREFDTFKFKDSRIARTQLNTLIGIYSEK